MLPNASESKNSFQGLGSPRIHSDVKRILDRLDYLAYNALNQGRGVSPNSRAHSVRNRASDRETRNHRVALVVAFDDSPDCTDHFTAIHFITPLDS